MIQRANQMGYTVENKVDRNTTYLVVADTNTNTVKARTARRLGVRIVTYSQFFG
jgi:NAD-dependent DNA ligase